MMKTTRSPSIVQGPNSLLCSYRLLLIWLCSIGTFLIFNIRFSFSTTLVCMTGSGAKNGSLTDETEFDWDRGIQANLIGAFFYGYLLTQVLGGWISDKFGGKLTLLIAMFIHGVCNILTPELTRLDHRSLLVLRFLQGCCQGGVFPIFHSLIPYWSTPEESTLLMAILMSGLVLSNVLTAPLVGLLCRSGIDNGWPMAFYVPGLASILWCLLFGVFGSSDPSSNQIMSSEEQNYLRKFSCKSLTQSERSLPPVPWMKLATSIPFLALIVSHMTNAAGFYFFILSLPLFINEVFHVGILENGIISGLTFIGPVLIGPVVGIVAHKIVSSKRMCRTTMRKMFTCVGQLVWSALIVALVLVEDTLLKLILIAVANTVYQIIMSGGFFTSHAELVGPFSGLAFGITNTFATIPGFVIPMLLPYLVPSGTLEEWNTVFYLVAVLQVLGSLVYGLFGSAELQPWART